MEKRMVRFYKSNGLVCYVDPVPVNLVEEVQNERTRIHFSNNGDPLVVDVRGDADSVHQELYGTQLPPKDYEMDDKRLAQMIREELRDNVTNKSLSVAGEEARLTEDPKAIVLLSAEGDRVHTWLTVEEAIQRARTEGANTFSVVGSVWVARDGKQKLTHARRVYFRDFRNKDDILIQNW